MIDENINAVHGTIEDLDDTKYDWVIASGVFNLGLTENLTFSIIHNMISHANKGIIFNMLQAPYPDSKYEAYYPDYVKNKLLKYENDRIEIIEDYMGDDAEFTAVITAFRDFQIGVMTRRQLDPLGRHQVEFRILQRRQHIVDGIDHLFILLRAGDGQHIGMHGADRGLVFTHTAGDHDTPVFRQSLPNRFQGFRLGAVQEAAGIDHDHIRPFIGRG